MLKQRENGFTIIEVVLVLAIAGLIFLAVFIALPQLQRSQRDSTRKSDVGRLIAGINQYTANEGNGIPPASAAAMETAVITGGYVDDFGAYTIGAGAPSSEDEVQYLPSAECVGVVATAGASNRAYAVVVGQENGPNYCQEG